MYKMIFTVTAKPGTRSKILEAAKPCIEATRRETGCLQYEFYACSDIEDRFVTVECFVNPAAHETHGQSVHFKAFQPTLDANILGYTMELIVPAPA